MHHPVIMLMQQNTTAALHYIHPSQSHNTPSDHGMADLNNLWTAKQMLHELVADKRIYLYNCCTTPQLTGIISGLQKVIQESSYKIHDQDADTFCHHHHHRTKHGENQNQSTNLENCTVGKVLLIFFHFSTEYISFHQPQKNFFALFT